PGRGEPEELVAAAGRLPRLTGVGVVVGDPEVAFAVDREVAGAVHAGRRAFEAQRQGPGVGRFALAERGLPGAALAEGGERELVEIADAVPGVAGEVGDGFERVAGGRAARRPRLRQQSLAADVLPAAD